MSTDGYLMGGAATNHVLYFIGGTSGDDVRSKHSWEISGAKLSASRSIRSKDYERESTSSGDNLHNHLTKSSSLVRLAANGGTSRSQTRALRQQRNTYPIKIVDNFFASRWHRHSTST
ncbi:hypothetical protein RI054_20g89590 [Pseudoscourfieldia marina]